MKFTNYAFEILFVDMRDPGFFLKLPVAVRATTYEYAVRQALAQGQEVLRDNNGERFLFMRLQRCSTP